jgi:flavin reductase (DIM6/NTAB) family NADH-FMN oxidoreductase RutF
MSSEVSWGRGGRVASAQFRRACGRFSSGVTIATVVDAEGTPHGLTVSSFTSVSLEPPLVLICLGHRGSAIEAFRASAHFGINVLAEGQRDLAERFTKKGQDRFDGLKWRRGKTGVPLLPGVLAAMECAVRQRIAAGDHDIFVGQMVRARVSHGAPLIHFASHYRRLDGSRRLY